MRRRVTVLVLCVCVCVCLSVCTPAPTSLVSTLKIRYVGVYLRLFLLFNSWISINPSIQKLWREKANMKMSSYHSRPFLSHFEYRAYTVGTYRRHIASFPGLPRGELEGRPGTHCLRMCDNFPTFRKFRISPNTSVCFYVMIVYYLDRYFVEYELQWQASQAKLTNLSEQ